MKEIHFSLTGAQNGTGLVGGAVAMTTISAEGTTTVTYFAVDNAGNQETPKTLTVRIDKTPPVITGLPAAGCSISAANDRLVQVANIAASDALSGLASGSPTIIATSNDASHGSDKLHHREDPPQPWPHSP